MCEGGGGGKGLILSRVVRASVEGRGGVNVNIELRWSMIPSAYGMLSMGLARWDVYFFFFFFMRIL